MTLRRTARMGSGDVAPEVVRVRLLGGYEVSVGQRVVAGNAWRLRKAASLVKILALARDHRLHRERVVDLLWPDLDKKSAANNFHRALHFARVALAPTDDASRYLTLQDGMLDLCPGGTLWVDVEAFEEAAAVARRALEPAAFRAAIELFTGDLLPEDLYEDWAQDRREALRETYHALLVEMSALYEQREQYEPAIEALRRAVVEEPAREATHAALMRSYALSDQRYEAVLQYGRLREALSGELDAEPCPATRGLYEEIRAGRFPTAAPEPAAGRSPEESEHGLRHNLPAALTSFVGREHALVEVRRELSMTRLLTLTGTGGSGKTRLALEVARDLVGVYPDGVWLVELAPLSDPELVPHAVAQALGVREQSSQTLTRTLVSYLGSRQTLLVLDNCEHLVEAAARLSEDLLTSCPQLRVLATSREPVGVPGEAVRPVHPLSLPDEETVTSVDGMMLRESVRLFVDRARTRLPDFELTDENAPSVARVCRKLDGIPLAIELATARMGALAVGQVAQRLEGALDLLTAGARTAEPRQRTLRATLDWSHGLLSEDEKALFGRLPVFAGGWTLEAAETVGAGDPVEGEGRVSYGRVSNPSFPPVLDLLGRLVDKSLVVTGASPQEVGGAPRYRMLEPVRQYAREKLEASGEKERLREYHAMYFLALAEAAEPELAGSRPVAWLKRLELERDNLRAALSWALDAGEEETEVRAEVGLRIAAALGPFWDAYGPGEGRRWLEKGLAGSQTASTPVRARALHEAGFIATFEGDPAATRLLEESLTLYEGLGDEYRMSCVYSDMGHMLLHVSPSERSERITPLRQEVEALLATEPSDKRVRAKLLMCLGFAAGSELDLDQMERRLEQALALNRELGDARNISECLLALGHVRIGRDDPGGAARFEEGLRYQRELKNMTAIFMGVVGMAGTAALRGDLSRSARLMGASDALREKIGFAFTSANAAHYDYPQYVARVRGPLGDAAFDAAFSEGRAMTPEQAIEYAISKAEEPTIPEHPPAGEPTERLTPREREVALLVGQRLTNRQVAQQLSISEHTVANHVARILRKLGLRSRAEIQT